MKGAVVEHRIEGTVMPVLEVTLQPGERVVAESGELSWMSESINLTTSTPASACSWLRSPGLFND